MSEATPNDAELKAAAGIRPAKNPLVVIFLILNSLLVAAVLAVLLLKHPAGNGEGHGEKAAAEKDKPTEEGAAEGHGPPAGTIGPTVRLADFVIHLRNPEADRYARLSFEIEVNTDKDKDAINAHVPKIREAFIAYLSDRTVEDLRGSDGIEKTKQALMTRLGGLVSSTHPRGIYITDIVIQ